ncbi:DUF1326 domain-containing protein [Ectothiorhodospiraceae bacterium WFHF3C12]|nr:DUF1326 domain-containing protein [Ectothiorhodospiraceae bacterium WFHF3C12]
MESWSATGTYLEACTCDGVCPCTMLKEPTMGTCTAIVGWHIDEGVFGSVPLEGLTVAMGVFTPGNMSHGDWKAALYIDDRADAQQQDALAKIFGGQAGGHPATMGQLVSDVAGVKAAPIQWESNGRKVHIRIGDVGEADTEPVEGQDGGIPTLENHPFAVAPGYAGYINESKRTRLDDSGIQFDVSDRFALVSPFSYSS